MGNKIFSALKTLKWSQKTDDELMQAISEGAEAAFNELFARHSSKVLGFAKKMLGSTDRAEEASQDVWVKVVKQAENYVKQGTFSSWVMMMTKNHCLNIIRKDKRITFSENPEDYHSDYNQSESEDLLFSKFAIKDLSAALDQLPEVQRVALTLLATEEPSYEDLATQLEMSVGALKSVIHRGRKALKEIFLKEEAI